MCANHTLVVRVCVCKTKTKKTCTHVQAEEQFREEGEWNVVDVLRASRQRLRKRKRPVREPVVLDGDLLACLTLSWFSFDENKSGNVAFRVFTQPQTDHPGTYHTRWCRMDLGTFETVRGERS